MTPKEITDQILELIDTAGTLNEIDCREVLETVLSDIEDKLDMMDAEDELDTEA